jgi:hypothetical protein
MADSSGALQRPPFLRAFLDAGWDLTEEGIWVERLAEVVYLDLPVTPPRERAKRAAAARARAMDLSCPRGGRGGRRRRRHLEEQRRERSRYWHWVADLYEAPELAQRVVEALPEDVVDTFEGIQDFIRRPHPISVRIPQTWWSCNSCGAAFDAGEETAVTVTGREDFSDLNSPIDYCSACIIMAAEVVEEQAR